MAVFPLSVRHLHSPSFSATSNSRKGLKLWRFGNISDYFGHIFTAHAQKRLLVSFCS